jgi:hypothetical protein
MHEDCKATIDHLMTALDKISTMHEGSPKPHDLEVHRIAGDAMRAGSAYLRESEA